MVAVAVATAALTSVAGAAPPRPAVRTVTLAVSYSGSFSYSNSDVFGSEYCGMAGQEHASLAGKIAYGTLRLRLASGSQAAADGRTDSAGEWTESGTQAVGLAGGADCTGNPKPLDCTGKVAVGGREFLSAFIRGGTAGFRLETIGPVGETGVEGCGSPDDQLPYLGFADAFDPWSSVAATVPLARLAALPRGRALVLAPRAGTPSSSSYDVATCNGASGSADTCRGNLLVTSLRLVVTRTA